MLYHIHVPKRFDFPTVADIAKYKSSRHHILELNRGKNSPLFCPSINLTIFGIGVKLEEMCLFKLCVGWVVKREKNRRKRKLSPKGPQGGPVFNR